MSNKADLSYILMGIKHSGKTTLGKMLSQRLCCPFFDTDEVIASIYGKSAREVYLCGGAGQFMRAEEEACAAVKNKLLASIDRLAPLGLPRAARGAVIATGGGICGNAPALNELRPLGKFVFLKITEEAAVRRIIEEADFTGKKVQNIPAFIAEQNPKSEKDVRAIFHGFYARRTRLYSMICNEQAGDAAVDVDDDSPEENFAKLLCAIYDNSMKLPIHRTF